MALQEQVVAIPLVGGVDENAHPRLCARMLTMSNCRQVQDGAISKRFGTSCVGPYNLRFGGSGAPPAAECLTSLGTDIVRIGYGQVDSCRAIGTTDSIFKGRASEALLYRRLLTNGESYVTDLDVAYVSGFVIIVFTSNAGALLAGTATVNYMVLDTAGNTIVARTVLDSGAYGAIGKNYVALVDHTIVMTWSNAATGILARTLDAGTLALGGQTTLVADTAAVRYAMSSTGDRFALAYMTTASDLKLGTWDSALSVKTVAVTVFAVPSAAFLSLDVVGATGAQTYVGWGDLSGTTLTIRKAVFTTNTLAAVSSAATIESSVVAPTPNITTSFGLCINAAGTGAWFTWVVSSETSYTPHTRWVSVSNAGAAGTVRYTDYVAALSRPFVANGMLYMLVKNQHSTHGTAFLVHLQDGVTPATTNGMRIVAVMSPRQVPRNVPYYSAGVMSSVAPIGGNQWLLGTVIGGDLPDSFVGALVDVRLGATSPVAVQLGGLLVCSGGAVSAYDGAKVVEIGHAWEPDAAAMSASAGAGSGLGNGTYYYLAVFEWHYANGAVTRSPPSYPYAYATTKPDGTAIPIANQGLTSVTVSGGNGIVTVGVDSLSLTNKQSFASTTDAVSIVLYRTEAGGATFYRASAVQIAANSLNNPSAGAIFITDTMPDATLITQPTLYTTGGALPSEIPPSAAHVAAIQGRIWLSGTDDDTIWISHEIVEGEAPTFSGSVTIAPFEGGRVVGVAALDDKKLIFKSDRVYVVVGTGPGIDGLNGEFSTPERVPTELGCIDARSIATTPQGVYFASQNGLALVGHDLSVALVGKPISTSVAPGTGIVATTLIAEQESIRFAIAGTATCAEYDMLHQAWGTYAYVSPGGLGTETIAGAAYVNGSWYYISSAGLLFKETHGSWADVNGAVTSWVPMRFRTQYISLASVQGYQRVWWISADMTRESACDITLKLYVDDARSSTQTRTWADVAIATWTRSQAQIHVVHQEAEALGVEFSDAAPTGGAGVGTGKGMTVFGLAAELGIEGGLRRAPAAQGG